ncbi:MAG: hypothetical protein LCI02_08570 [Proteobacteria bacterium]|nr:hypothetical protein [Pseudomonadota bacterium]
MPLWRCAAISQATSVDIASSSASESRIQSAPNKKYAAPISNAVRNAATCALSVDDSIRILVQQLQGCRESIAADGLDWKGPIFHGSCPDLDFQQELGIPTRSAATAAAAFTTAPV